MRGWMHTLMTVVFSAAMIVVLTGGCKDREVTTQTEVQDKLLGGKEVKETEVIEEDGKVQVREKETEIDRHGNVEEREEKVTGDKIK